MFGIFRSRTAAYYFTQDLRYGGAAYKSTGRDFGFKHLSFVKIYSSFARSHFYYATEVRGPGMG